MRYSFQLLMSIFLAISGSTFAQERNDESHKWDIGISLIFPLERSVDSRFSSLEAKGVGVGAKVSIVREFELTFLEISADKRSTDLTNKPGYDLKQRSFLLSGSFGWLLNSSNDRKVLFGAGVTTVFLRGSRIAESFSNFNRSQESIGMIGLNLRLKSQLSQTKRLRLENNLSIPILTFINNEEYGTGEGSSGSWKSSLLFRSIFLRSSNTLGWQVSMVNFIGVDYTWVFYELESSAKKISASHQIGLKYILSL